MGGIHTDTIFAMTARRSSLGDTTYSWKNDKDNGIMVVNDGSKPGIFIYDSDGQEISPFHSTRVAILEDFILSSL